MTTTPTTMMHHCTIRRSIDCGIGKEVVILCDVKFFVSSEAMMATEHRPKGA